SDARSHGTRVARRAGGRRLAGAGASRRGAADRRRARPHLVGARRTRRSAGAAAGARPLSMTNSSGPVLALSGGIGGVKLALGLYRVLPPDTLTVVANPGADFEHPGLSISPHLR